MNPAIRAALALSLALASSGLPGRAEAKPGNLLANGGFEKDLDGWKVEHESGKLRVEIDGKVRAEGKRSARLVSTFAGPGFSNDRLTAEIKRIPAGKRVVVSARVQGEDLRNAFLKVFVFDAKGDSIVEDCDVARFSGKFDWKDVDRKFDLPKEAVRIEVRFCMFLGGTAWLDDMKVVGDVGAAREATPTGDAKDPKDGKAGKDGKDGDDGAPDGGMKTVAGDDGIPTADLRAGKDERRRYLLHGPRKDAQEPKDGWKLAVVMPGGPGTAEFAPFVKDVLRDALTDDYVVAQPVAVKWTEGQEIVWPRKDSPVEGMQFTTEEFVDAVVEEVAAGRKVDRTCVFTLSWSSSGPAAYAIGLREKTPVTGSFVAMSVFFPQQLPPLSNAKGRAFYLYQSPQDEKCRLFHAEKARDALKDAGAKVELRTYEGGHGWTGDTFADIRRGFEWLEKQSKK
jgi:predicted esterase